MATSSGSSIEGKGKAEDSIGARIIAAATNGDIHNLTGLIEDAHDNRRSNAQNLFAALQRATRRGHLQCVRYLLAQGVKPDQPGDHRFSPLHGAIETGIAELVLLLLNNGADLERRDPSNCTPLMSAALKSQNKIVNILLEHGASIEASSQNGRPVLLFLAASPKSSDVSLSTFKILLNVAQVDLEQRDPVGKNVLMWAVSRRNLGLARLVIDSCDPTELQNLIRCVDYRGKSALHMSLEDSTPAVRFMILLLLTNGADIDATSDGSLTPLAMAAARGNYEAVDVLLTSGADVGPAIPTATLNTANSLPTEGFDIKKYGPNVNSPASAGMTPLHWAARNGYMRIVHRLLACKKISANLKDDMFRSPLLHALENGHFDIVSALYAHICGPALSENQQRACNEIMGQVVDVKLKTGGRNHTYLYKESIREIVYERSPDGETFVTSRRSKLKEQPDFRWIHLPANNVAWCEMFITKYFLEAGATNINGLQACIRALHDQHREGSRVHSRCMETLCIPFERVDTKRDSAHDSKATSIQQDTNAPGSPNVVPNPHDSPIKNQANMGNTMLFMPYLHWEDCQNSLDMWTAINNGHTSRPTSLSIDDLLILSYLSDDQSWHPRRTLDQSYHSSIDTKKRDVDQVVSRHFRKKPNEGNNYRQPIIMMVHQLWTWVLADDLIVTCAPQVNASIDKDPLDLFGYIFQQLHIADSGPQIRNIYDFAALIALRCFGKFDSYARGNKDFRFLEIFEEAANELTNLEVDLFEAFSRASLRKHQHNENSSVENGEGFDASTSLLDVTAEISALRECKDLREELMMLDSIFDTQLNVAHAVRTFGDAAVQCGNHVVEGTFVMNRCDHPEQALRESKRTTARIAKQASTCHENLIQLLDLKQKQASVMEAAYARNQSEETVRQGKTIMVFTITTIIFLPISFLASFFAINIEEFSSGGNAGRGLQLSFVLKYTLALGLATSLLLILVAFNVTKMKGIARMGKSSKILRVSQPREGAGIPMQSISYSSGLTRRLNLGGQAMSKNPYEKHSRRGCDIESA